MSIGMKRCPSCGTIVAIEVASCICGHQFRTVFTPETSKTQIVNTSQYILHNNSICNAYVYSQEDEAFGVNSPYVSLFFFTSVLGLIVGICQCFYLPYGAFFGPFVIVCSFWIYNLSTKHKYIISLTDRKNNVHHMGFTSFVIFISILGMVAVHLYKTSGGVTYVDTVNKDIVSSVKYGMTEDQVLSVTGVQPIRKQHMGSADMDLDMWYYDSDGSSFQSVQLVFKNGILDSINNY